MSTSIRKKQPIATPDDVQNEDGSTFGAPPPPPKDDGTVSDEEVSRIASQSSEGPGGIDGEKNWFTVPEQGQVTKAPGPSDTSSTTETPAPTPALKTPADAYTAQPFQAKQGTSVNLPGFDSSRTDLDPKQVFGQFAQQWLASGKPWGADAVNAFVSGDPRWETSGSAQDPLLRVKQAELDKWKPGTSPWQDVIGDAGGENRVQYGNAAGSGPGFAAPYTGAGGAGGAAGAGGVGGLGGSFQSGVGDAISRLLGRGEAPLSASDPNIAGPTTAFKAQAQHATARARNALAERAAAAGLNSGGAGSGAMDSGIQSQLEQEGRDVGSYQSGLMVQELMARRQDVVNALQFAQGEERLALQAQLAQMNDALQRAQLGQQNQQFYDTMSYNVGRDQTSLDNILLQMILAGG